MFHVKHFGGFRICHVLNSFYRLIIETILLRFQRLAMFHVKPSNSDTAASLPVYRSNGIAVYKQKPSLSLLCFP